jgi:putative oxidoreductase
MKIVATIARYLLGIIFLIFGSNLFFHFLPNPPMPPGPMADFSTALFASHYILIVGIFQVVPAILLLINRFVPLALTVLAGVIINIDLTHMLMAPSGLPIAALVTILWFLVFYQYRSAFFHLFRPHHSQ